ncbi:MAG: tetratricopeptide repeat protein [Leptolyngbyaceae cyanobacterium]
MSNLRIDELLKQCTVKLSVSENGQVGTGFLVAPGYILTCEHVVRGAAAATVGYKNNDDYGMATVEKVFADKDVALLQFEPPEDLPCVLLDTRVPEVGGEISTFGYPYRYEDDGTPWKGIPALLTMEGTTGDEPPYLQLSLGNVLPGMSGGALLDRTTGHVCGMLKFTRDEHSLLGGGGVMSSTIAQCIPEVIEAQRQFHEQSPLWREAKPFQSIVENLPQNKAQAFKGREKALGDLHTQVENGGAVAIMSIRGMGGVGKTELALQYADRYRDSYPGGICWLAARESNIGTGLVQYAKARLGLTPPDDVDLPQQVAYCWQQWPGDGDVLVVYDDVTDYRLIEDYLPLRHGQRIRVLLTTRVQNVATTVTDFPLETLVPAAALELMEAIVGIERIDAERQIAEALCERVGYLPLGLELLGYFLKNKPSMSLEKLLQRLEKNRLNAKAFKAAHPGMTAKLGVIDAFELSWAELSEAGQEMACWLSLFALAPTPWELAIYGVDEDTRDEWDDIRDDELLRLSLLQDLGGDSYQLHQLVREFFLAKLEERGDKESLPKAYCGLMVSLAKSIGQSSTKELTQQLTPVIPHIEETIRVWKGSLSDEDFFYPFSGLTFFYYSQGTYDLGVSSATEGFSAVKERFGDEHPSVATSLNNLAALYRSQGRYEQAEPLYQESLELLKKLLGDEHPDVATSLNNLAVLYANQKRYFDAESRLIEALDLRNRLLGNEHPYTKGT